MTNILRETAVLNPLIPCNRAQPFEPARVSNGLMVEKDHQNNLYVKAHLLHRRWCCLMGCIYMPILLWHDQGGAQAGTAGKVLY